MNLRDFIRDLSNSTAKPNLDVEVFIEQLDQINPKLANMVAEIMDRGPDEMSTPVRANLHPNLARILLRRATYEQQRHLRQPSVESKIAALESGNFDHDAGDDIRIGLCEGMIYLLGGRHRCAAIAHFNHEVPAHIKIRVYKDHDELKYSYAMTHQHIVASNTEKRSQWLNYSEFTGVPKSFVDKCVNGIRFVAEQEIDQNMIWPSNTAIDDSYMYGTIVPYYKDAIIQFYHQAIAGADPDFVRGLCKRGRLGTLLVSATHNSAATNRLVKAAGDLASNLPEAADQHSPARAMRALFMDKRKKAVLPSIRKGRGGYSSGSGGSNEMAREICIILWRYSKGEPIERWTYPTELDPKKDGNPTRIANAQPKKPFRVTRLGGDSRAVVSNIVTGVNHLTRQASKAADKAANEDAPRLFPFQTLKKTS